MLEKLFVSALLSALLCAKLSAVSFKLPSPKMTSLKLILCKRLSAIKLKLCKVKLSGLPLDKLLLRNVKL